MDGFRKFLMRGNVVDLSVAVVMGAAFGAVVTAVVTGLVTPLIGAFGGLPEFAAWRFTINGSTFQPGLVVNSLFSFVVVAAVIYWLIVMPANRLADSLRPPPAPGAPTTKACPECLSTVPLGARRCAHCTSQLAV